MYRVKTSTEKKIRAHDLVTEELEDHQQKQRATNSESTKAFSCRIVSLAH